MAADVPATQAWVEQLVATRIGIMQSSMSANLRAELEESKAQVRTSLDQLSGAVDVEVTAKFDQADARFAAERQEIRGIVEELKTKWDLMQDGSLKALGDRLAQKEFEDLARLNQVALVFRSEVSELCEKLNVWKPSIEMNEPYHSQPEHDVDA